MIPSYKHVLFDARFGGGCAPLFGQVNTHAAHTCMV